MKSALNYVLLVLCLVLQGDILVEAARRGGKAKIYLAPSPARENRGMLADSGKRLYNVVLRDTSNMAPVASNTNAFTSDKGNKKRSTRGFKKSGIDLEARKSLLGVLDRHLKNLSRTLNSETGVGSSANTTILVGPAQSTSDNAGVAASISEPEIQSTAVIGDSFAAYTAVMDDDTVDALSNSDDIAFIEEDFPVVANGYQAWSPWGLTRINQASRNDGTFPLYSNGYSYSETGKGVTAYILDSGMNKNHVEFKGDRIKSMVSFAKGSENEPGDDLGHGTMVASALGGNRLGVAKGVTFKSVKVISKAGGTASNIVSGLNWIVDDWKNNTYPPSVINMSVGSLQSVSKTMDTAVSSAESAGLLITIAAGNIAIDACKTSPSSSGAGLVVGAISQQKDRLADFSNNGPCVQVLAPGEKILLASYTDNNKFEADDGTSFSSPYVGGIVALYLEKNPKATPPDLKNYIISKALPSATELVGNTTNLIVNYAPSGSN